jgi:UDP-N-acetylglucosamine 4,6-dehydratase/5-epimerase
VASERGCTVCVTRYGNVMASRGSVIPLFVDQLRRGGPLTVTDPAMTRFMMSSTMLWTWSSTRSSMRTPGDLFVQKAPAATIGTLAEAVKRVFESDVNPSR